MIVFQTDICVYFNRHLCDQVFQSGELFEHRLSDAIRPAGLAKRLEFVADSGYLEPEFTCFVPVDLNFVSVNGIVLSV